MPSGYRHTTLPRPRGSSIKHPGGRPGPQAELRFSAGYFCTDVPAVPTWPSEHTCIWGSASGLALGGGGGLCALDIRLLQNPGQDSGARPHASECHNY